jgi:hypothetical protein
MTQRPVKGGERVSKTKFERQEARLKDCTFNLPKELKLYIDPLFKLHVQPGHQRLSNNCNSDISYELKREQHVTGKERVKFD